VGSLPARERGRLARVLTLYKKLPSRASRPRSLFRLVAFSNPLIGVDKQSIMLVAGTEASFRNLRVWEALPNEEWSKNKAALLPATK
jgi:hypothetical protein